MAKPGVSKKKRGPSINSRAMRRATSPGIDTDKSIKEMEPPRTARETLPSVLAARAGAGVTKKTTTSRKAVMSARAKRRHERGVEMAAAVSQRLGKKVERSSIQGKVMRGRGKAWEEVNTSLVGAAAGGAKVKGNLFAALGAGAGKEEQDAEHDVPVAMAGADEDGDEDIL